MARREDSLTTEAAHWHVRQTQGELTDLEERDFLDWINANPAHAIALAKVSRTWDMMSGLTTDHVAGGHAARPLFSSPVFSSPALTRRAATAALVAAIGGGGIFFALNRPERISTGLGEQRHVTLADGSHVFLNTSSSIEIAFGRSHRTVDLVRGEASFDVAKDADRVFRVIAAGAQIAAIGTSFNVRLFGPTTRLLVAEGLVAATPAGDGANRIYVPAGNEAEIKPDSLRVTKLPEEELRRLLSWQEGVLEFTGQTVQQIAAEFNRYSPSQIIIADAKVGGLRFGGRFGTAEATKFVDALCSGFPVRSIRGQDGNIYLIAIERPAGSAPHA